MCLLWNPCWVSSLPFHCFIFFFFNKFTKSLKAAKIFPLLLTAANLSLEGKFLGGTKFGKFAKLGFCPVDFWEAGLLPSPQPPWAGLLLGQPTLSPCCWGWFALVLADQCQCGEQLAPRQFWCVPPGHHLEVWRHLHGHRCHLHQTHPWGELSGCTVFSVL